MVLGWAIFGITTTVLVYGFIGFCIFSDKCSAPDELPVCKYGNLNGSIPTLGTMTADVTWGATDHKILARIFYGDDDKNGQWSDWHAIDNVGCDDRERGQIDFYEDFSNIYERWLAVALYNCGTDGFALDAIFYWNGTNFHESFIDKFCGNVAGPMVGCYGGAFDPAETGRYCFEADQSAKYYDHVWIDQNDRACPGVLIATGKSLKGNASEPVGKLYGKADPGVPDCDQYSSTNSRMTPNFRREPRSVNEPDVYSKPVETVTLTSTSMNVLIAAIAILVCLNVAMMAKMWCTNNRGRGSVKAVKYAKVDMEESSA